MREHSGLFQTLLSPTFHFSLSSIRQSPIAPRVARDRTTGPSPERTALKWPRSVQTQTTFTGQSAPSINRTDTIAMRLASALVLIGLSISAITPTHAQTGSASWYALDGNRTANGETMDSAKMTAAHPTLPFGTKIKVTNVHNGKSVVVRINDRGPFAKNRVLDVSKGAASQLGFVGRGHAAVEIARVDAQTQVGAVPQYASLDETPVSSPTQRPVNGLVALLTSSSVRGTPPPVSHVEYEQGERPARSAGSNAPGNIQLAFRPLRLNPALAAMFASTKRQSRKDEPGI